MQQLRKKKGLTQEQLAEKLYVSRTAISKWESGKGYPNIESLKSISKLFNVSIDQLLSGEELITLAEEDKRYSLDRIFSFLYGFLDIISVLFIILPLYGQKIGTSIYSVNLINLNTKSTFVILMYWLLFILMIILGIIQIIAIKFEKESLRKIILKCSFALDVIGVLFCAQAREPYITTFLFILFLIKIIISFKNVR